MSSSLPPLPFLQFQNFPLFRRFPTRASPAGETNPNKFAAIRPNEIFPTRDFCIFMNRDSPPPVLLSKSLVSYRFILNFFASDSSYLVEITPLLLCNFRPIYSSSYRKVCSINLTSLELYHTMDNPLRGHYVITVPLAPKICTEKKRWNQNFRCCKPDMLRGPKRPPNARAGWRVWKTRGAVIRTLENIAYKPE